MGPLIFIIYINDLPHNVHSSTCLFADDTTFNTCAELLEVAVAHQNQTIKEAKLWFDANELSLKVNETRTMYFNNKKHSFSSDTGVKFLGIILDPNLNFQDHTNALANKMCRGISFEKSSRYCYT